MIQCNKRQTILLSALKNRFEEELLYDKAVAVLANQIHTEWGSITWYFLTEHDRNDNENTEQRMLEKLFSDTMDAVHELEMRIATNQYLVISEDIRQEDELIKYRLKEYHGQIFNKTMDIDDMRDFYEDLLVRLQNEVFTLDRQEEGEDPHWQMLVAMQTLLTARNNLGIEHFLGQKYFYGKTFDIRDYNQFVGEIYVTKQGIESAQDHYERIEALYKTMYTYNFELNGAIRLMEEQILRFKVEDERPDDIIVAIRWRDNMTSYAQILEDIELLVAKDIEEQVNEEKQGISAQVS